MGTSEDDLVMYLSKALCPVPARAMDQERVEEDSVPSLHFQVHPGVTGVIVHDPMIQFVNSALGDTTQPLITNTTPHPEHSITSHFG